MSDAENRIKKLRKDLTYYAKKYYVDDDPEISDFERFFADQLSRARRIIHITAAAGTFREYERALQASRAFGNVIVIDSGALAASSGMLVMAACRLVQQSYGAEDIVACPTAENAFEYLRQ